MNGFSPLNYLLGNEAFGPKESGGGEGGVVPNIQATAETLPPGSEATVARTGSDANPVFHFGIPRGDQGKEGDPGKPGEPGENGATFTPSVSAEGVISWSNDGGLPNPDPQNIKGSPGNKGDAGPGVPPGGSPGQVLVKKTAADYDAQWSDPAGGFDIYSLEERVVGRWIDGKPLYKKTFIGFRTTTVNTNLINVTSLNIDTCVKTYGTVNHVIDIPLYNQSWGHGIFIFRLDGVDNIRYIPITIPVEQQNAPLSVTIEYTKTTDQATIELPAALTAANTQTLYKAAPQSAAAVTLDAGIKTEEV